MKFAAPVVSRNMNLIFLTSNMAHQDDYASSSTTSTPRTRIPTSKTHRNTNSANHHEENTTSTGAGGREGRKMSQSMPFPSTHVHRTQSEIQLCEDEEMAERRDLTMFYRLVNGIRERQTKHHHHHLPQDGSNAAGGGGGSSPPHHRSHYQDDVFVQENSIFGNNNNYNYDSSIGSISHYATAAALETERSLAHIIHTRNSKLEDNPNPASAALDALNTSSIDQMMTDALHAPREGGGSGFDWSLSGFPGGCVDDHEAQGARSTAKHPVRPLPGTQFPSNDKEYHHQQNKYSFSTPTTTTPMIPSTFGGIHQHHQQQDDNDIDEEEIFDMEL
jgi:hypothetical protein